MKFFGIIAKRVGEDNPVMEESWSEYERDADRNGFDEDVRAIRKRPDVEACAVVTFNLSEVWLTDVVLRQVHNAGQVEAVSLDV